MITRRSTSKFLFCLFHPLDSCFLGVTLRNGVTVVGALDVALALVTSAALLGLAPRCLLLDEHKPTVDLWLLVTALPFAVLGLLGITQLHRAKVDLYSYYKHFEYVAVIILTCRAVFHADLWDYPWVAYAFYASRLVIDFYMLLIVWSCSTRMANGQEDLVLCGPSEATHLLKDSAYSK